MSTPDPRRGDEPGDPITPAPSPDDDERPEHDSVSPAFDGETGPDDKAGPGGARS